MPLAFFQTQRLCARAFTPDDVETFVAYRQDPNVARYQSWADYTLEQGRRLVASNQELQLGVPGEWYQIALQERSGERLIGDVALKVDAVESRQAEIGFTLSPAAQGKGYATEAVEGLLHYAFGTMNLHRIIAITDALNEPAASLLARIGMRREAHFVENTFFKGSWGSEFLFAVLDREWSSR